MTDRMREDPVGYWNEEAGPRWVAAQAALDRTMIPITETLLSAAAASEGETVLDVGCGCGETTVHLGRAVGANGRVLGVDVSSPMVARAKERTAGLPVSFVVADATTHPFEGGSTELAISRFGVMFFAEPTRAFINLHRALVPRTGRLVYVAWQAPKLNPWLRTAMAAVPEYDPGGPPPVDEPGPFGLATRARAEGILSDAGFHQVTFTPQEVALSLGETPQEVTRLCSETGPLSRLLGTVDATERAKILERVERYFEETWGSDKVRFDAAYWLVEANA